jgi:hypothetical protein
LRANPSSNSSLRPIKVLPIISKLSVKQQIAVKESISTTAGGNGSSARNATNDSKWHFTNNQKYGLIVAPNNNHQTSSRSQLRDFQPLKNLIGSKEKVGVTLEDKYKGDFNHFQSKELNSFMTRNSTADLNMPKCSTSTYSEMSQEQWTKLE